MTDHFACPNRPASSTLAEPSDLTVAIRVARRLLADYSDSSRDGFSYPEAYGALRESLRLVLRAHGADPVDEDERARHFPHTTALLTPERGEHQ
ncbi:hypothetical protein [Streptomyces sp. NPDC018693]|uniref:hypothetical protein n=1 Tax=unclassified Streptomyces TaxID=2593676 RepID=UPI00378F8B68